MQENKLILQKFSHQYAVRCNYGYDVLYDALVQDFKKGNHYLYR